MILTNEVNSAILSITVDSQIQSCPGLPDAKAWVTSFTVTPGSTGPYVFTWNVAPTPTQTGDTAFNIGGGSFVVTGIDLSDPSPANNALTQPFIVASKNVLFVNGFVTPESCFGAADGSIISLPGGGTPLVGGPPNYLFSWSPAGNTTQNISALSTQAYTVTVTDANGCTVDNTFNVGGPTQIQVNLTIDSVDCNGGTAIATIAPAGGTGVYPTVEWSSTGVKITPDRFVEGGLLGSLAGINYSVTVTDNSGCTQVESFSINEPLTLGATVAPDTIDCFGTATGTAVATVTGGTPPFIFDWPANPGRTSNTQGGFNAGSYTVIITDAKGCVLPVNFPIEQRDRLNLQLDSVDVDCNGNLNGQVNGTITGGIAPYFWVANDPAGTTGNTAVVTVPNLNGRKVIVTVTDFLGCIRVDSIVVNEPQPLTARFTGITNPSCVAANDGTIDVTFSGGNGTETFTWNGLPFGSVNRIGLIAGNYVLVITDIKGCNVTIDTTLVDPIPIVGNLTFAPPKCFGGNDGRVLAAASGGSGVYTNFNFGSQNGASPVLNGVSAGLITVTITDSDGCTGISSINVTQPTSPFLLDIVADSVNCNGESTGGATATPRVPLTAGPYTWNWTNSVGAPIGTNDSIIVGFPIGKYFITSTDGNGCQILDSVVVEEPNPINTAVIGTNLNCNGDGSGSAVADITNGNTPYSWSWSTTPVQAGTGPIAAAIDLDANVEYFLTVIDNKGCTKLDSVTLTEPTTFDLFLDSVILVKCFGENNGAIFVSDSGGAAGAGFPTYVWSDDPTTAQDRIDLIASATPYKIVATDANSCKDSVTQIITQPTVLAVTIIDTDSVSCTGVNDGTATALATGGTVGTGYVYTWSTLPVQNGPNATGLSPGAYTVQVTDSNGCVATSLPVTIFEPITITTAMTSDSASCAGFNDGSATVTANGGTLIYTYLWDANAGSQIAATATNLLANAPAFYVVTVTDKNGCQKKDSVQVGQPTTFNLSITSQRNVDCAGNLTGEATIGVTGGRLPYSFIWENTGNLGTTIGINATQTGLPADTFRVTVTDGSGCNDNIQVIITQSDSLKGSITASIDPSCLGGADGSATVTATGGSISGASNYVYSWSTIPTQTTPTATGLVANQLYTVTITDDSLCTTTVDVSLAAPNVFVTSDSNIQNVSCFGGNDGFIRLTPTGGTIFPPPANAYSITWTSPPSAFTASGDSIFNLTSGRYIALIQDLNGCTTRDTFDLDQPGGNLSLSFDTTDVSCVGSDNGTAKVNVLGGTPGYTFNWIGTTFGNVDSIFGLATGTYRVSVADANGCSAIDSTIINPGTPISLVIDPANPVQDVTCSGAQDGSINLIASGGVGVLGLQWYLLPDRTTQIGTNTNSVVNLGGGTYRILVIDGICSDSLDVVVNEPDTLKAELNKYDINCGATLLGRAAVRNITGGNAGGQSFTWTPDPGVANGGGTDSVFNLTAGNYSVRVFDLLGCDTTINFTISQTASNFTFTDSLINDSCIASGKGYAGIESLSGGVPPYSFEWSTNIGTIVADAFIDNLTAGNYSVTISDAGGCDSVFNFAPLTEPNPFSVTVIANEDTCLLSRGSASIDPTTLSGGTAPYTFAWPGNISGQAVNGLLGNATYQLTITDAKLCVNTLDFTIGNVAPFTIAFDTDSASCKNFANGAIRVTTVGQATGVTTYTWFPSISGGTTPTGLLAGTYSLNITDANGCVATGTVDVEEPDELVVDSVNTTNENCAPGGDGTALAFVSGGNTPYRYNWGDGSGFTSLNNISTLTSGNYTVTVQDRKFCSASFSFKINTEAPFTIDSTTVIEETCPGANDGSILVHLSNTIPVVSYTWSSAALSGPNPTSLGTGPYGLTVTDGTNCTVTTNVIVGRQSSVQTIIPLSEDETCSPGGDGWAKVAAIAGVEPYSFAWSPNVPFGSRSDSAFNLVADDYFVTTTDGIGCTSVGSVRLESGANIDYNLLAQTIPSCFGDTNGSLRIEAFGGVAPYSYRWSNGSTDSIANNLRAGSVSVTITDNTIPPCVKTFDITIASVNPISLSVTATIESCAPGVDGSATVVPLGGTGPYSYVYSGNGTPGVAPDIYEGLTSGPYSVSVTDASGCSTSSNFSVTNASTFPFSASITKIDPTCATGANGELSVQVNGGSNPFTYSWLGGNGNAAAADPTNLIAGTYTVTVSDFYGCEVTASETLIDKAPITASFALVKDDCPPANSGSATATAADGVAPYSYSWPTATIPSSAVSGVSGEIFSNLPAGTFNVTITDANLCSNIIPFTIEKSAPFTLTTAKNDISCNGLSDGSITLTVTGVSTPNTETYQWTPNVGIPNINNQNQTNLAAGAYLVTVTDPANSCEETETFIIVEPDTIAATAVITNASCAGGISNGTITLTVTGGKAPYSYNWGGSIISKDRSGLAVGDYTVSITDSRNCATFIATYSVTDQAQFTVSLDSTDVTCPGLRNGFITATTTANNPTYAWSDGLSTSAVRGRLFAGKYIVTVTDGITGCQVVDSTFVNSEDSIKMYFSVTDENCSPGIDGLANIDSTRGGTPGYTWSFSAGNQIGTGPVVTQLSSGTILVTVTDILGCTAVDSFEVKKAAPFNASFIFTDAVCQGDSTGTASIITSNSRGSLTYTWPLGSVIDPTDSTQNKLLAGTYIVNVFDLSNQCDEDLTIIIDEPDTIKPNAIIINENCIPGGDGSITLAPSGGDGGPYTFNWNGTGVVPSDQNQNNLSAGTYFVTITDGTGCTSEDSLNVIIIVNIVPNLTIVDVCQVAGLCNGSAEVSPTNGAAPYSYEWTSSTGVIAIPPTTDSIGNLCTGSYTVKITDATGCDTTIAFTINGTRTILPNAIVVDESCGGTDDGSISVTPSGGAVPYSYAWLGSTSTDSNRINLAPASYSVTITDASGCFAIVDTAVNTDNFDYTISSADLSCLGGNDGTADITIVGGAGGYTFNWTPTPANGQGTPNISNLSVGTYSVLMTNASSNCSITEIVDILPSSQINPNEIVSNESCFGQNDGSIILGVVGGAGNYTYNWSANVPTGTTGNSAIGLTAGTYTVQIIDAAGCDTTLSVDIIAAGEIIAAITNNVANCSNTSICDGSAVLTVSSSGTFSYVWSPGILVVGNDSAAISLCPGNYFVDITNSNGCTKRVDFTIGGPSIINPNITSTDATCNIPNGGLASSPTGGTGTLTVEWLDNTLSSIGNGVSIGSLPAGAYFAVVEDAVGCRDTFPTSISDIGGEDISITASNPVTCFGGSDGGATVNFVCTDPLCTTEWFAAGGISLGSGRTITGLQAGDYYVEVDNNTGCLSVETITITQPNQFSISEIIIGNDCFGGINGGITLSVSGAAGNFSYLWTPAPANGQGTNAVSGLAAGTYTVNIFDGNGCDTTLSFDVQEPLEITATFDTTSATCNVLNGQIIATISGGTVSTPLAYDYQWFDNNNVSLSGATTNTLNNIGAGTYSLRVRDENGCEKIFNVNLSDFNGPTVIIDSVLDAGCFGASNGGIFITASGINSPLTFNWLPTGAVSEDLTNLSAGIYSVKVTDALGCITFGQDTVRESSELMAVINETDATCGQCNGTAAVTINGGTAPYSYLWSNGATADSTDSLCGGNYTIVVTDANGCSKSFDFGINTTGGPTGETVSISPVSCANASDGAATVTPIGGTPPYTYLWQHNGATSNSLSNLSTGTYFVQISDVRSCSRTVQIDITNPSIIVLNPQVVSSTCNQANGSILLNVTGGQPPYSYNWFTATIVDTNFINNRAAGLYPVNVTDANGCIQSTTIAINNTGIPTLPTPTGTDVTCFGQCDGSLISNISGVPVDFRWLDAQRNSMAPLNTDVINSVCAGDYFIEIITNPQGCKSYVPVTIKAPDSITLTSNIIKDISCNGDCNGQVFVNTRGGDILYTYSWDDPNNQTEILASGLCADVYTVTATDANGCMATTSITLTDPLLLTLSTSNTNLVCSSDCNATAISTVNGGSVPYTFSWSGGQTVANPTDLCFGMNILTVTDARSCIVTDTILVSAIDTVIAESLGQANLCDGDLVNLSGTITGSSITSFGWYLADTTTLLTTTLDTSFVRPIGNYTYYLNATSGTCSDTARIDVTIAPNPLVNLASEIRRFGDEVIVIELGNEDPSYTYLWNPGTNLDDSTKAEPTTLTEENRTYTLLVTDTNGCTFTDSILVVYSPDIEVPSGFTPNSDGNNDVWNIQPLEKYPNASVQIYNRWGQLLYEQQNGYSVPWDGKYEGKELPIGTYYYIINLKDSAAEPLTGPITIIR
ncbi:gliding motility-associated C-terminal domain-containing protein [Vicingaceae bacterium]|nr:gliding motility-associated C-terminal domain-containing protein [Vicingaceae bacterium]